MLVGKNWLDQNPKSMKEKLPHLPLISPPGVEVGLPQPLPLKAEGAPGPCTLEVSSAQPQDFTTPRKRHTGKDGLFLAQLWVHGNIGTKVRRIPTDPPGLLERSHPRHPHPSTMCSLQG